MERRFIDLNQSWLPKAVDAEPLFPHFFNPVPQEVFLKIPWLDSFDTLVVFDWYPFGSILASEIFPFGTRLCKAAADNRRHPRRKNSSLHFHLTNATCGTLPQAIRFSYPIRIRSSLDGVILLSRCEIVAILSGLLPLVYI